MASCITYPTAAVLDTPAAAGYARYDAAPTAAAGWAFSWSGLARALKGAAQGEAAAMSAEPAMVASSGFPALDAVLPSSGWLAPQVTEIFSPGPGHPELAILAPMLRQQATSSHAIGLLGCPRSVDDHRLAEQGLALAELEVVSTRRFAPEGPAADAGQVELAAAWLQAHRGGALVMWQADLSAAHWRTLRRAVKRAQAHLFLVRPALARWDDSPADLSLSVLPSRGHALEVRVRPAQAAAAVSVLLPVQPLREQGTPAAGRAQPGETRRVKVTRDPRDLRRTAISGSMAEVCRELDRLVALEGTRV